MKTKREELKSLEVITALITPFKDAKVDYVSFRHLLKSQISQGIHGFVINGTTAESPSLDFREVKTLFDIVRGEAGASVYLILGVGLNSTEKTIQMAKAVEDWKPNALLAVTPYYNKPPQRGLVKHYKSLAESVSLPILLYNVPKRTGVSLSAKSIGELSFVENIIGVKEASGNMELQKEILSEMKEDFLLFSGDDVSCLEFIQKGGAGVISVLSHLVPSPLKDLVKRVLERDQKAEEVIKEYKTKYSKLIDALYSESNPIPAKMALFFLGLIESPELRLPLTTLDFEHQNALKEAMKALKLLES